VQARKLFKQLNVNISGIEELRETCRDFPVVLLPTHRWGHQYREMKEMSFLFRNTEANARGLDLDRSFAQQSLRRRVAWWASCN
jgi:hypothetical protein